MGENAQKIGKKLESFGWNLFGLFNWKLKMKDKQINCVRSTHKNKGDKDKKTHGVDIYLEYEDPYINKVQGVFIECKNRQWVSINSSNIEEWIDELINTMECAIYDQELNGYYAENSDKHCGLLLINTNDGNFNKTKFYNYIENITYKSKRMPIKVFIAGNDMINKWWAIDNINATDYNRNLQYIYLSINNSRPLKNKCLSINHLYSKYIFCEYEYQKESMEGVERVIRTRRKMVILCFDKICRESFNYLWSICRFNQFEINYKEYDICFFPESSIDTDIVKEDFMNVLKTYEKSIEPYILENINVKFLQNRDLTVVENQ